MIEKLREIADIIENGEGPGYLMQANELREIANILEHASCSSDPLTAALEAVLLFHGTSIWGHTEQIRWAGLTGRTEATTRVLCDTARAALAAAKVSL